MTTRSSLLAMILLAPGIVAAKSPRVLFSRAQIGELRQRIAQPDFAPLWAQILADAEAYCNPKSSRYADPQKLSPSLKQDGRTPQQHREALVVHAIGRALTQQMDTIGFAYQMTGRKALGQHGAALLLATIERYPVTNPVVSKGMAGGRGDLMRGLAAGYDLLADCLDDVQRQRVAAACADYLERTVKEFNDSKQWWYKVHNYNGVNGGAAGCLALALADTFPERSDAWVHECEKTIRRWLDASFDKEGAYIEGVGYSGYGLSNTVVFADALRRNGKGDLFAHPALGKMAQFYALSLLPGERVYDARNDSHYVGLGAMLLKLADARQSGLYKWLWENGSSEDSRENFGAQTRIQRILWQNNVPALDPVAAGVPCAQHFQGRGLCVWRTGWTRNDVMFSIEAGPFYRVTHNQADKGHFTLYGLGHRWATDPGYANEHEPEGRGQTLGHNCVLIDGKGQALSGAGWGTNGTIVRYANTDRYGYALADCTEAYNHNSVGKPGAVVEFARRHAFFVYPHQDAPAYAVVVDDLRKDNQPHDFAWQMMYSDELTATLDDGRTVFEPSKRPAKPSARLVLRIGAATQLSLLTDTFTPGDFRPPATFPRLRATVRDVNPRFIAVLLPLPAGTPEPKIQFASQANCRLATIQWPRHSDTFAWTNSDGSIRLVAP